MSDLLNKGFILSLDYLYDNNQITSYIINKFILSIDDITFNNISGIRLNSYNLVIDLKQSTDLPIIGYINRIYPNSFVNITPTLNEIHELAKAGAKIIYLDASMKIRPNNQTIHEFFYKVKSLFPELKFIGEVSTIEEIENIKDLNFDFISIKGDYNIINSIDIKNINVPIIFNYPFKKSLNCNKIFEMGFNNIIITSKFCTPQYRVSEFIQNIF